MQGLYKNGNWQYVREALLQFIESRVYPAETTLSGSDKSAAYQCLRDLKAAAKTEGLWALGHPAEIGGQGMPFLEYVYMNEVIGRSEYGQLAVGTYSLQDSLMMLEHAPEHWRETQLPKLVGGDIYPSFAMTEPDVASSDPTQIQTRAVLHDGQWTIDGHKWFTTGADIAAYTTVMCRTEDDAPPHKAFSMIIVPTDTPGYQIVRDTPLLGVAAGHFEVNYDKVRVPEENLIGKRGDGFVIAQKRLGPGRIFHCMRWLGQAQRAFDLMCERMLERTAFGSTLAEKQLMQLHVFDSYREIQACRQMTLHAAECIDRGDMARIEIGAIKVAGAKMLHNVIDRAVQVYGAKGLTDDTPLSRMYRHAREARIYDGPDEVHVQSVARLILKEFKQGRGFDFSARDAAG